MRVAYLASRYPALSHTFIRREVAALRRRGLSLETFSIRRPSPRELLNPADRAEAERTRFVLPARPWALFAAHLRALFSRPRASFDALLLALRHRVPGVRAFVWALFYFAEALRLSEMLRSDGIDHLHVHFSDSGAHVGILAARFLGIPWSLTLHGTADFDQPAVELLGEKIRSARFVACVSHFGRAQALRTVGIEHWPKLFVSRCGVSLPDLPEAHRRVAVSRVRLLSVGRLSVEKGHGGLLEAFAALLKEGADAELRLVGDGPMRGALEERIAALGLGERVVLLGGRSEQEVSAELAEADAFVLPSLMEGLPVVLMEAMAHAVPVVAPRVAGIPELVREGESGWLFDPARWEQLAECLARLVRSPEDRVRLGAAGRRRVEAEFRVERAVEPLWQRLHERPEGAK